MNLNPQKDFRSYIITVLCIFIFILNNGFIAIAEDSGVVIISNQSIPINNLSKVEFKNIFIGKIKLWENGDKVIIAVQKEKNIHEKFLRAYIKKSPKQYFNYWRNLIFTGKSNTVPKYFNTEDELIEFISSTTGAIGYISSNSTPNGVKIISVQ